MLLPYVKLEQNADKYQLVGSSKGILAVKDYARIAASSSIDVLIRGETGTGKENIARTIHKLGSRTSNLFVIVNCPAIPYTLAESEIFGVKAKSFTGGPATDRTGRFEYADGGTIFLDEIGDLDPKLQAKLLRFLQEREVSLVGDVKTRNINVQVIAATHHDLEASVASGSFREDLYHRLNVFEIKVPPLRERKSDILQLIPYFIQMYNPKGYKIEGIKDDAFSFLMNKPWYGNVRELEHCINRAMVLLSYNIGEKGLGDKNHLITMDYINGFRFTAEMVKQEKVSAENLPQPTNGLAINGRSLKEIGKEAALEAEKAAILEALGQTNWNRAKAAALLRISYKALLYKMENAGLSGKRG